MDGCGLDAPNDEGMQELHTDFDNWICRFEARLVSRSCKSQDNSTPPSIADLKANFIARINWQKSKTPPSSLSLQEIIVNGIILAQKRITYKSIKNSFNLFKRSEDATHYDYVILALLNEKGRKNLYRYVRSKI